MMALLRKYKAHSVHMNLAIVVALALLVSLMSMGFVLWLWAEQQSHHHGTRHIHAMVLADHLRLIRAGQQYNGRILKKGDHILVYEADGTVHLYKAHPNLDPVKVPGDIHRYDAVVYHGKSIPVASHAAPSDELPSHADVRITNLDTSTKQLSTHPSSQSKIHGNLTLQQFIADGRLHSQLLFRMYFEIVGGVPTFDLSFLMNTGDEKVTSTHDEPSGHTVVYNEHHPYPLTSKSIVARVGLVSDNVSLEWKEELHYDVRLTSDSATHQLRVALQKDGTTVTLPDLTTALGATTNDLVALEIIVA